MTKVEQGEVDIKKSVTGVDEEVKGDEAELEKLEKEEANTEKGVEKAQSTANKGVLKADKA